MAKMDDDQWREAGILALGYQIQLRADFNNAVLVLADLLPQTPRSEADWRRVQLLGEAYVRLNGPNAIQQSRLPDHWTQMCVSPSTRQPHLVTPAINQ